METINISITNRKDVALHLHSAELIGAVSIYLYGNKYGYVLDNTKFEGIIKD